MRGCMYNYGWLALLYGRNQHNIVKILKIFLKIQQRGKKTERKKTLSLRKKKVSFQWTKQQEAKIKVKDNRITWSKFSPVTILAPVILVNGFPRWLSGKEPTCQCGFDPSSWKIPCRSKWQPTPVFLPEKPNGQRSLVTTVHGVTKSRTQLSDWTTTNPS